MVSGGFARSEPFSHRPDTTSINKLLRHSSDTSIPGREHNLEAPCKPLTQHAQTQASPPRHRPRNNHTSLPPPAHAHPRPHNPPRRKQPLRSRLPCTLLTYHLSLKPRYSSSHPRHPRRTPLTLPQRNLAKTRLIRRCRYGGLCGSRE